MSIAATITLSEAVQFINGDRGKNYPDREAQTPSGHCLFLNTKNVRQGYFDFSELAFIDEERHRKLGGGTLSRNDIVVTIRGTLGNTAIYRDDIPFDVVRINSAMLALRPRSHFDPDFIERYLRSSEFLDWVGLNQRGSAQPHLRTADIETARLPLVSMSQQRRIVAKIDSLSAKSRLARDHLDHIPRLVEKYKQAILAAAFRGELTRYWRGANGGFVSAEGVAERLGSGRRLRWLKEARRKAALRRKSTTDAALLAGYESFDGPAPQPLGPEGWFQVQLGAFAIPLGGKRLPKGSDYINDTTPYPYIRVTDFTDGKLDTAGLKHLSKSVHEEIAQYCVEVDDLCISIAGTIGSSFVVPETVDGANLTENASRIIAAEQVLPAYLDLYLKSAEGQRQIAAATVATGQPKLALFKIEQLLVPLCIYEEQAEVVLRATAALNWIDRLAAEATNARRLIDHLDQAILAKAFRGELVPQDPSDEPASVLLERIRAERQRSPKIERGRSAKR